MRMSRLLTDATDFTSTLPPAPPVTFGVSREKVVAIMTGVDEILSYKQNPDDDFYGLLGCDENSSVSTLCYSKISLRYFV